MDEDLRVDRDWVAIYARRIVCVGGFGGELKCVETLERALAVGLDPRWDSLREVHLFANAGGGLGM